MDRNKVFPWDAILIGEDKVFTFRSDNGFVQYFRLLEASVFVPDVFYRQLGFVSFKKLPCLVGRTVIGNDDFIGFSFLAWGTTIAINMP